MPDSVPNGIENTGEWPPILSWLEALNGGPLRIPIGSRPPITRDSENGWLRVENRSGIEVAKIGDFVFADRETGELHVFTKEEIGILRDRINPGSDKRPIAGFNKRPHQWNNGGKSKRRLGRKSRNRRPR